MRIISTLPTKPSSVIEQTLSPELENPQTYNEELIHEETELGEFQPRSEASRLRVYKNFILSEAAKRQAEMAEFMFFHQPRSAKGSASFGGVTVAFKVPKCSGKVFSVEISTFVCPSNIQFDKKFGRSFAALNLLKSRSIFIPASRHPGESVKDAVIRTLYSMFT